VNRNSCGMLIGGAVIAGVSLLFFPAAAESPKDMGVKWGGKCATGGRAAACCKEQRSADAACKNLEKEKAGSSAVKNCEEAEKVCEAAVRSAEEAKKTEDEKKKKAEDAKRAEENKAAARPPTLPSARQVADNWQKELTPKKRQAAMGRFDPELPIRRQPERGRPSDSAGNRHFAKQSERPLIG
jgi:gas vesicle protein